MLGFELGLKTLESETDLWKTFVLAAGSASRRPKKKSVTKQNLNKVGFIAVAFCIRKRLSSNE